MIETNTCKQCGNCCKLFFINLNEDEYNSGKFKTMFDDIEVTNNFSEASASGANFLAKKEDGGCIYLEKNFCKIHDARPRVCRKFFCDSKSDRFKKMNNIIDEHNRRTMK